MRGSKRLAVIAVVGGVVMGPGDGLAASDCASLTLEGTSAAEIVIFDLA